jgi:hypothetical protein
MPTKMTGVASKGLAMVFASATAACSPSAVTKCEQAALAHYCTAVTAILGHARGGVLGTLFLAKSRAYATLGQTLGYLDFRERYLQAALKDLTPVPQPSTIIRVVELCFSHQPAAVRRFVNATKETCRAEK